MAHPLLTPVRVGGVAAWTVVAAGAAGLGATYWDDAWHTRIGRDSAMIPPHLMLYAGTALAGLALAGWVLRTWARTASVRDTLRTPGLALAVAAGAATAAAAPADAFWHAEFGRDAVLWAPTHLLAVIATIALVVGLLVGAAPDLARSARVGLGALLLGASQVVVLEYDTDVPQFPEFFYVPIAVATAVGSAWVVWRLTGAITGALLAYVGFRVATFAALELSGWPRPDLPVPLLGLLVARLDALGRWRLPAAAATVAALQVIASITGTSSIPPGPTLLGAAVTLAMLIIVALATRMRPRPVEAVAAILVAATLPVLAAPPARAHDPGQGEEIGKAHLTTETDAAGTVLVRVEPPGDCPQWSPVVVVARRAGRELRAPLEPTGTSPCAFGGSVRLPTDGTWFVYTELTRGSTNAEAWIPVDTRHPAISRAERSLYQPAGSAGHTAAEIAAAIVLYTGSAGLVLWAGLAVRRAGRRDLITR